ncbi:MAG: hypothetical protein LBC75_07610 [Fibromonadaceae bacterium]|jgi:uncharacterized protein (TIGR02145 family)|nr:hypothetical protein [Fibromonadaceae bacterium]
MAMKDTFTDPRDGKEYKTVKIGEQVWMAQNLAYVTRGSRCSKYYDNDVTNGDRYGLLYDWDTAISACPPNWHLPSYEEWQTLVDFAGGKEIAGKKLKSQSGWDNCKDKTGNGTDDFGFSALPSGFALEESVHRKYLGIWWTSSLHDSNSAYGLRMVNSNDSATIIDAFRTTLFNVRCIQDDYIMGQEELHLEAVKRDGKALKYVPENLKTEDMCFEAVKNWTDDYFHYMFFEPTANVWKINRLQGIFEYIPEKFKAATVERCLKTMNEAVEKTSDALNMCLDPFPYK